MKMTSWSCCVLIYDRTGEPVVHSNEPGLPRQMCLVQSLRLARRLQKQTLREKRVGQNELQKNPLTAVLESWLLSILQCRFFVISVALFPSVSGWSCNNCGSFRKWRCIYRRGDWWAVEGASHSCYQEPSTVGWGPQHDVLGAIYSWGWSRELMEGRLMIVIIVFSWGIY